MSKFTQILYQSIIISLIGVSFCVKNSEFNKYKKVNLAQATPTLINVSQDQYKDYKAYECERSGYNDCDKAYCNCLIQNYKGLPCYEQINGPQVYWYCYQNGIMRIQNDGEFLKLRKSWLETIKSSCLKT